MSTPQSLFLAAVTSAALGATTASAQTETAQFEGAVFAMSNKFDGNTIVAYGRGADGMLAPIGEFATGGRGAAFDGGEGLDPLISAYSLVLTEDNRFVLAVNAGSNTVSALRVEDDYSLTLTDVARSGGVGPNSIAVRDGLIYVSNIDADGVFNGEPDQEGSLSVMRLSETGELQTTPLGLRQLENRPSAVQFSPDGRFLVVASINAGSAALASGSIDELVVYAVQRNGLLSAAPVGAGTSTLPFNADNRNLPSAIGFEIVESDGQQFVVVTEAREFQADGAPPAFDALQTGSVSVFRLGRDGGLSPFQLDVLAGDDLFDGERTACWIEFDASGSYFFVTNALEASISTYSFAGGNIGLLNATEATGIGPAAGDPFGTTDGFVDLWASSDGKFLYVLHGLSGEIGVYEVDGDDLTLIQRASGNLPTANTQGIVAI